jgi:nitrite reductase/ring-hydroxylating ferredoxin subunit
MLSLFTFATGGYLMSEYLKTEDPLQDFVVCDVSDLPVGHMKEVKVGPEDGDTVLVANVEGNFYCVSSKCTHFGFGLSKGVLIDDKVICPLHSASFSVITGYPESGPVLEGLNTYETRVENNKIIVRVPKSIPRKKPPRQACLCGAWRRRGRPQLRRVSEAVRLHWGNRNDF